MRILYSKLSEISYLSTNVPQLYSIKKIFVSTLAPDIQVKNEKKLINPLNLFVILS